MRLKNVDGVKVNLAVVLLGKFVQGGNLPPKRRSCVAPEDQDDRPIYPEGGQIGRSVIFQLLDRQVGSCIANVQMPIARPHPEGLEWKHEVSRHGHLRHHVAEDLRRPMHGPVHVSNQAKPASKQRTATLPIPLRTRLLRLIFTILLFHQPVHFEISLRSNPEGIRYSIKEREHCGDIDGLSDLRLRPAMIPQLLHILRGRAIGRFRHLGHEIEKRTFRRTQACLFQIAICDGLYRFIFCSLNTQEVCMRVQSIGAAIEPRDPARNRFLGSAVEMTFRKMDRITELDYLAQKIGAVAEAFQNAGHLLAA